MHHAHVKRKEHPMNNFDPNDYYSNPARFHQLAQRERSRALLAGFTWLRQQLAAWLESHPNHWVARLG
jgi:hypothetical protein